MKTQHTPGPWIVAQDEVTDCDGNTIVDVVKENTLNTAMCRFIEDMPWKANAELIAAAPQMLKFIQKVAHWELVDCDQHEYVMEDEEVRAEAHRILDAYNERLKLTDQ